MKTKLIAVLLFVFCTIHAQIAENIQIPGFGELPVKKTGNEYQLTFGSYGTYSFKGSIRPLELETTIGIKDLEKFPGYSIFSNLGLQDIRLKVSTNGLIVEANADTKKNLATICKFLQISEPLLHIKAEISNEGYAMEGEMDFSKKPKVFNLIPSLGTRFTYQKFKISSKFGVGSGETDVSSGITVRTEMKIRPTKWDPDLQTVFEMSYDLLTQEIVGSGSMTDTWKNPIGISNHFNKDVISLSNSAVKMGWIPGSPTPTSIGFFLEQGKFFDLDFAVAMDISPADAEVAVMAKRAKMTMNDYTRILRKGFGLQVPDVFPEDISIEDAEILFSPSGGEVGEFEIDEGFAMKGRAKLLGAVEGQLHFYTNWNEGFFLEYNVNASIKDALMKEIRKVKPLAPIMNQVLSTLEVRKVHLLLKANMELQMEGKTHVEVSVLGKKIKFDLAGKFDPQAIVNEIVKQITNIGTQQLKQITSQIANTVTNAGKESYQFISGALGEALKQAKTASRHATHSKSKCDNECVPKHAKKLYTPVLKSSNEAVKKFHDRVLNDIVQINGLTQQETSALRTKYIHNEWNKLIQKIDSDWARIRKDDSYVRFYLLPSSATNGGKKFRKLIDEKKSEHLKYRNKLWMNLMTDVKKASIGKSIWHKNAGWHIGSTQFIPVETDIQSFVLVAKSDEGVIYTHKVNPNGTISELSIARKEIKKGNWAVTSYNQFHKGKMSSYVFVSHSATGEAESYYFNPVDGKLGKRVWNTKKWVKGINHAVGFQDKLFIYNGGSGNAWVFEVLNTGQIGKMMWKTNHWTKGIDGFAAVKDNYLYINKSDGNAWLYAFEENQFSQKWKTTHFVKGIGTVAAKHYSSSDNLIFIGQESSGTQWILNYVDADKSVRQPWKTTRWKHNITRQAFINKGKHVLISNPETGEAWIFNVVY